jgi:pimeloyl-ACP methyl ester carboxylesterase
VLLESSGPASSLQYRHVLPVLGRETMTCAYDRAGMGFSDLAAGGRSAQDMVDDLVGGLASASIPGPYLIVAGSFGGLVAELFARERPAEVVGLVTLDALTAETVGEPAVAGLASKACLGRWAAELGLLRLADPFHLATLDPMAFQLTYQASTWRTICRSLTDLPVTASQLGRAAPFRGDLPGLAPHGCRSRRTTRPYSDGEHRAGAFRGPRMDRRAASFCSQVKPKSIRYRSAKRPPDRRRAAGSGHSRGEGHASRAAAVSVVGPADVCHSLRTVRDDGDTSRPQRRDVLLLRGAVDGIAHYRNGGPVANADVRDQRR